VNEPTTFSSGVTLATASSSMPREVTSPVLNGLQRVKRIGRQHILPLRFKPSRTEMSVETGWFDLDAGLGRTPVSGATIGRS